MSVIGIDSGSSIVKLIEADEEYNIINKLILDKIPIQRAFEIFIDKTKIDKTKISKIVLTGIGKDEIQEDIDKIPTIRIDEFIAIGTGGLFLTKQKSGLIVSIGTGTAFVKAKRKKIKHIGGSGVGGGTLINLSQKIANIKEFSEIEDCLAKGSLADIDLTIQDISKHEITTLPKNTTASNFGKLNPNASKENLVTGIANMVFETIGMMAVFATQNTKCKNIIVIGSVTTIPYTKKVLKKVENLHKVKFIIPNQAEFATILGAIKAAN